MIKARRRKGPNPKILFGFVILVFAAGIVFVRVARQRQDDFYAAHPTLTHYVLDDGALVGRADKDAMESELEKLNKDGAAQALVVVEQRLTGASIAEEALNVGRTYRIGHAGRNDGVVLLIAAQEKHARIEVGYGLEGILTDAQSRLIIANAIEPYLAREDFSAAARHGLDAILAVIHPAAFVEPPSQRPGVGWILGVGLFVLVIVLIGIGALQALVLAIPGVGGRIAASRRWNWFARVRILGGAGRDDEREGSSSGASGVGGGGSFGGGGAND